MKILVFGAGAVGLAFGSFLSRRHDVTLYGRKHWLDPVRRKGLFVSGIWGKHHFKQFRIETDLSSLKRKKIKFDLILVTVKSFDTVHAARSIRPLMGSGTLILSLQNGLGNLETLATRLPKKNVLGGRVIFGIELISKGKGRKRATHIRITVAAEPTAVGEAFKRGITIRTRRIASEISRCGIPTVPSSDVRGLLWLKAAYNCALNPLASLLECHYGLLGETRETRWIMDKVMEEVYAAAKKARIRLRPVNVKGYQSLFYGKLLPRTYHHHPSMLQDLLRRRPGRPCRTEIDAMNGAIVRLGKKYGVPTPMNQVLTRLMKKRQQP